MRLWPLFLVVILYLPSRLEGGTFLGSDSITDPFVVVHSPSYTGTGGEIELRVCLDPAARS